MPAGRRGAPSRMCSPTVLCIPARWASQRLPGKLARLHRGVPVVVHAVRAAVAADLGPVFVISDDARLLALVQGLGAAGVLAEAPASNGSERVAAALAAGHLGTPGRIMNVQGDAVGVTPDAIRAAAESLDRIPEASLGTAAVEAPDGRAHGRTTVAARGGRATGFSRRELHQDGRLLLHIGVYAYVPDVLRRIARLPAGPLERAESLEQLRWLEHGETVAVAVVPGGAAVAPAVDVASDLR
jgi:3-deoxy-manno-octulosonate cytidylyltransferase (CMP-KDO synthetase)